MIRTLISAPVDFSPCLLPQISSKSIVNVVPPLATRDEVLASINTFRPDIWICSPCPPYKIEGDLLLCLSKSSIHPVISTPSTGSNHINISQSSDLNIKIFSLRSSPILNSITASSEYTLALMLSLVRGIPEAIDVVSSGNWRNMEGSLRSRELTALTVGIIGYGRIGSNLARYCSSLGMRVFAHDPYKFIPTCHACQDLNELLSLCDILTCCVHLSTETSGMINDSIFSKCKKGIYFINTSRGEIVDENSLLSSLDSGIVKKAAVDVICDEERYSPSANKLVQYYHKHGPSRLFVTPHIAGLTIDSEEKAQLTAFTQAFDYIASLQSTNFQS